MSKGEQLPPPNPYHAKDPRAIQIKVDRLYHEANKIIEEAVSPEKLKENPFKGKPIRLEENPYDRGFGLAHRMLKNAGHTLPWIDAKREIIEEQRAIARAIDEHIEWLELRVKRLSGISPRERAKAEQNVRFGHRRFVEHVRARVAKLRQAIERYNLEVPLFDQQVPNVRPETYVAMVEERAKPLLAAMDAGNSGQDG